MAWLREFAATDMPVADLAELITRRGVKVEGILDPWAGLEGVVVVRVLEVRDHPNADALCLARIQHGAGETELVVGVRNMRVGDLVPWAPPGARVATLDEPLGRREIRGVASDGMLCAPDELAISADHGGILILDEEEASVGEDLKHLLELDQPVLDIEVEPNRPDFLSIRGVAREVAAATGVALGDVDATVEGSGAEAGAVVTVTIEAWEACPRYTARIVRGVSHRASPARVQARLTACGMRPIDAVVDATNYTMLELGQPLHGFDLARVAGPAVVVRRAKDGEQLRTLDGAERNLDANDLLICDAERPIALAGVMGGETSEVSGDTGDVLLESAYFTRGGVLQTARRLELHSEASHRFERGIDPEGIEIAAARCARLMTIWAGGTVAPGVAAAGEVPDRRWVSMRPSRASKLLGYAVEDADAVAVFDELRLTHRGDDGTVQVEVPGYRTDLEGEVDLIEEVLRVQGYDRVGSSLPRAPHPGGLPDGLAFVARARDALARAGLREIRPAPFASSADLELFGDTDAVRITNPLRAEEGFLRTRLTPSLLDAVARNGSLGVSQVAVFEVGRTFRLDDPVREQHKLGFALSGPAGETWASDRRELDVLDAKGILEAVLSDLGVTGWTLGDPPGPPFHPGRSATVAVHGIHAGLVGELHPRVAESLGIDRRVAVAVLGMDPLRRGAEEGAFELHEVSRFPPVRRDLAFVVPASVPAGALADALLESGAPELDRSVLFDVFAGPPLPEGTRSLAFSIELRAPDRTLTDDEAAAVVTRIVATAEERFGATLRSG
jgi:phenylalanyl-tRNA synthetase beta chain